MELSSYSQDGTISLYFLLPFECEVDDCSKLLKYAFQACKEHELCPVWLTHEECLKLLPTKQDVFVCDPFEGEAFEYLLSGRFKCVVLGPRCLLTCLHSKKPVPELPPPLHNMAMHEMVITSTGFEKDEKIHIQKLVEKMCGIYSNSFHEGITHLIAKAVGTKKYLVAMEKEIPVMTEEWVEAVWKLSNEESDENVSATHEQFIKYSCPVFRGLIICVSQMPRKEKDMIKNIIEKNGGTYAPNLEMSVTSLLITATADGEKYKHATQWRIPCVKQDWLHDSIERGFALPSDNYTIKKEPKSSTPTNLHSSRVVGPPDVSICSTIMHDSSTLNVNETRDQELSLFLRKPPDSNAAAGVSALEEIDLQEVLKAGHFLDGCKIFASGFDASLNEKLRRIFNLGGAIRLNNMSEAVTHVVVGKHVDEHLNVIKDWPVKPYVVTGEWLVECIKNKKVVEEEKFLYLKQDNVMKTLSPLPSAPQTSLKDQGKEQGMENDDHTYVDEELMNQYMSDKNLNSARKSVGDKSVDCSTLPDTQQSSYGGMFKGLTFTVSGYSEEIEEQLIELICENGGEVLDVKTPKAVKYAIVSLEGEGVFVPNALNYITHIYLEDCFEQESLMPVEYYHMPFPWPSNSTVLRDCVLATSTYKGKERAYISHMATTMGALCQDMFSKRSNLSKGIRASTHLLCPSPQGSKYAAAKKWGIPAVTKDWLLMCAFEGCKVHEQSYSVEQNPRIVNGKEVILSILKRADKLSGDSPTAISFTHSKGFAVPLNKQVQNIKNQISNEEQIQTPDADTIRKMYPTPGGPSVANDSIDEMPTPDTPYGSTWYKNPPPRIRKGLKRVLDSMPDNGSEKKKPYMSPTTPEEFYFKKHTENLKKIVANNPFPEPPNFNDESFSSDQNQRDKKSPEKDEATPEAESTVPADHHGPLTGVVVYSSRKLAGSQKELYKVVTDLGGDYRWTYDSSVTHFLHYGRMNDTNKEFRIARDEGKFIVAPDWVWMCRDEGKRMDESLFPHVHNPKMSLSIISTKSSPVKGRKKGRKKKMEGMVIESQFEEDCEDDAECGEDEQRNCTIVQNINKETADKSRESLAKELEELENLAAVTIGGQRKSLNSSTRSKNLRDADTLKNKPSRSPATQQRQTGNTETESQNTAITWDDPQEREARARLEVALVGDTEDILARRQIEEIYNEDKENSIKEANISSNTAPSEPIEESPKYIIALSGMSDEDKEKYTNIVNCLRGSTIDGKHFDPSITHIISQKPSRSEKHLAAIASGKWILYRSFLDFSEKAGHFVEEAPHEWGNPSARLLPPLPEESTEGKLSFAAHRWRIHFGEKGYGAFHNMKVMFYSSKDRVAAFTRLIEAGGGEVIKDLDYVDEVTHCFVEMNKAPKTDLAIFASRNIPCLPPMYLNEFLINYPPPDEMESCIQEYKDILNNMTFSDISRISRK